ncbi:MAG TPA: hypothetical protein VGH12_02405 [Steroidobacteraceae bacterium]
MLLQREGRLTEAEHLLRDAVSIQLSLYGPEHYKVGYARVSLAILLDDKATSAPVAQAHAVHAYALEHLGKSREAAEELDAAVPILLTARGADDPVTRRAQLWLAGARPASAKTASTSH